MPGPPIPGGLTLVLACPQCGAPETLGADAVSFTCAHCSSLLIVTRPGREALFTCELTVPRPADVGDIVILYRVQAYRAEVVARWGQEDGEGNRRAPAEDFILRKMRQYEEELRARLHLAEAFLVHVPYWHLSGTILQAILGRQREGPKRVRLRAFAVEHTVPAYDEARLNLRDRGLRMGGSRLHPLTRARVQEGRAFLPWHPVAERTYLEIRKWQGRDLDPDLEPVTKQGAFVFARRFLVYRPYWLARLAADREDEWVLVDGTFGTLAGHPDAGEVEAVRAAAVPEPPEGEETRVVVRPSRCPDCGADQALDRRARVTVCGNCHLALVPTEEGLRVSPCDHGDWGQSDLDADHLPFWAFPFTLTPAGGQPLTDLAGYARALFPQGLPPGFSIRGDRLFVPAFRLLGTELGDDAFGGLVAQLHAQPPVVREGKLPVGGRPSFKDVTVSEAEAGEAARFVLYALHGRPSAARLNTLLVRRLVEQPALQLGPARLVFLPFARAGEGLALGEVELPRLLLDQGPEVDAMRATVYQPRPPRSA